MGYYEDLLQNESLLVHFISEVFFLNSLLMYFSNLFFSKFKAFFQ